MESSNYLSLIAYNEFCFIAASTYPKQLNNSPKRCFICFFFRFIKCSREQYNQLVKIMI